MHKDSPTNSELQAKNLASLLLAQFLWELRCLAPLIKRDWSTEHLPPETGTSDETSRQLLEY